MIILKNWQHKTYPGIGYNYWVSYPESYCPDKKYPLIIFLHGAGEVGPNPEAVRIHGVPKLMDKAPYNEIEAITVSPQCPGGRMWFAEYDYLRYFILDIISEYKIDPDAVSITGLSMGGYSTFIMAQLWPEIFSAAAPICGGGIPWIADRLKDIPLRIYHGDADSVVPVSGSLEMCDRIHAAGNKDCELILLHNVDHNSWDYAYERTDLISWLSKQRRK